MKYGILLHKHMKNIGDDVQSYAASRLLPSVDYVIDREHIDEFHTKNDEPCAVIMSQWYLWRKWNWPPARCIVPHLIGVHVTSYGIDRYGTPLKEEFLDGVGGGWLKSYAPVGCRDINTVEMMKRHGIDAYFSGCVTLTLPKQPETEDRGKYVCAVDVNFNVERKIRRIAKSKGLEVKKITHMLPEYSDDMSWDERKARVERLLTLYQNARCVITSRLHVSLPCLAMEVPVLCLKKDINNSDRFAPYTTFLHCGSPEDYLSGKLNYDISNPPKNPTEYMATREKLIDGAQEFIKYVNDKNNKDLIKINYSEDEKIRWQNQLMKNTLEKWLYENREYTDTLNDKPLKNRIIKNTKKKIGERISQQPTIPK